MKKNLRNYLIALSVFAAGLVFTVFCGVSITRMSGRDISDESEPVTEKPEESSSGGQAVILPEQDSTARGSEESQPLSLPTSESQAPVYKNALSDEDLQQLSEAFDGTVQSFYASGERDGANRPESCFGFDDLFLMNGLNVKVFNDYQNPTATLTFILATEYDGHTLKLLDLLKDCSAKAVFFTCQGYAEQNPEVIRRIIEEGHVLGSMGASLPSDGLARYGLRDQMNDVLRFHTFIADNYGYTMDLFYYGYDLFSLQSIAMVNDLGYTVCFFSANYLDYDPSALIDTQAFADSMKEKAHYGVVYSFHTTNISSVDLIPDLVLWLREQGYTLSLL